VQHVKKPDEGPAAFSQEPALKTLDPSTWFENRSIGSVSSVIIRVRIKGAVVGD